MGSRWGKERLWEILEISGDYVKSIVVTGDDDVVLNFWPFFNLCVSVYRVVLGFAPVHHGIINLGYPTR